MSKVLMATALAIFPIIGEWLRAAVFDCAGHAETVAWMDEARIIGELDYATAERLGLVGRGGVAAELVWEGE